MASNQESPADDRVNRLSTEKLHASNDARQGSGGSFSLPEIAPAYKNDVDLEQGKGIEIQPGDNKLAEISSTESPQNVGTGEELKGDEEYPPGVATRIWHRYRSFGRAIIWILLTAYILHCRNINRRWWICGLILHRDKWLIPFLLYLAVTLWLIFRYVPISVVTK